MSDKPQWEWTAADWAEHMNGPKTVEDMRRQGCSWEQIIEARLVALEKHSHAPVDIAEAVRAEMANALIGAIRILKPEPGDMLVLESASPMSQHQAAILREQLAAVFPESKKIILDVGLHLSVLKPGGIE